MNDIFLTLEKPFGVSKILLSVMISMNDICKSAMIFFVFYTYAERQTIFS